MPKTAEIIAQYQNLLHQYFSEIQIQKAIANRWSWTRVFVFLFFLIIAIYIYFFSAFWGNITAAIGVILFVLSVKKHALVLEKLHILENLAYINQKELDVLLEGNFSSGKTGEVYIEPDHFFANDLDLFGEKSFFQFANRCVTHTGETILADNLKNPLFVHKNIQEKQNAIKVLENLLDFRQKFQAKGMLYVEKENDFSHFKNWLQIPKTLIQKKYVPFVLWFNPIISLILVTLWVVSYIPFGVVGLWAILNMGLVFTQLASIQQRADGIDSLKKFLKKYIYLFEVSSQHIENIKQNKNITATNLNTFVEIIDYFKDKKIVEKLLTFADNSHNGLGLFGLLANALILWNWQILFRLEKHLSIYQDKILILLEEIQKIDVLNTWANLAYNNPETYTFPTISDKNFVLIGENIAHPLLPPKERIGNPVFFDNEGQLAVITGANMAGKSTYLRSITLNLLLAMQGSVVCAKKFECTPIMIYTSMRTKDSLASRESFFYAEIKRLKQLLDRLAENQKIFVVLDEILKGTNSADQHSGAKALLTQLVKKNAVGLIATHDLRLGEWAKNYPQHFKNQCFEIHINENHLQFTYQLQNGINQNLNATFLLKQMGIIEIDMNEKK
ncbi:MAG: hypothetical protein EAZ85_12520 [Bacteroidetes bacterium]|nr:MAG: hypothetical protein EAZ85_12520 [Bacteroidota bacterium]TAG89846.1 MAG: hypothetical protein EAZ20_05580 [Bacteroidota bacterium]